MGAYGCMGVWVIRGWYMGVWECMGVYGLVCGREGWVYGVGGWTRRRLWRGFGV
jgi:hypothetical protein